MGYLYRLTLKLWWNIGKTLMRNTESLYAFMIGEWCTKEEAIALKNLEVVTQIVIVPHESDRDYSVTIETEDII